MHDRQGVRFVQVAISQGSESRGPHGLFELIRIAGYRVAETADIYFAAVHENPLNPATLLALFPVALGVEVRGRQTDASSPIEGFVGLSISCAAMACSGRRSCSSASHRAEQSHREADVEPPRARPRRAKRHRPRLHARERAGDRRWFFLEHGGAAQGWKFYAISGMPDNSFSVNAKLP